MAASEVLKRLEEIETRNAKMRAGYQVGDVETDKEWLCARLRDALTVIEAVGVFDTSATMFTTPYLGVAARRSDSESALAAYRRLFGEGESRGE